MSPVVTLEAPVLIVGGGPTGLVASLLLSRHGIRSLLVERHPGTSIYPRATGVGVRSMEILRSLGLEAEVLGASFRAEARIGRSRVLVDPDPELTPSIRSSRTDVSPSQWTSCSQFELEPILVRAAAAEPPAELRFGTELIDFEETAGGVTAHLFDRCSGEKIEVRSRFLIGADGSKSLVRQKLGIAMAGPGLLGKVLSIHFTAPIRAHLRRQPNFLHFVSADNLFGIFIPTDGETRWTLAIPEQRGGVESERQMTDSEAIALVRRATGIKDLQVELQATVGWQQQADSAVRYREGSVFLAGDAAHRMTPAGGLGMNTGIQDSHNLCWKLAAVIQGWAGGGVLDSYDEERRPVGESNAHRSMALITGDPAEEARTGLMVDLGFTYRSRLTMPDGSPAAGEDGGDYQPVARPGSRAPHLWLTGLPPLSCLDLFGPHFTLLNGPSGEGWRVAVEGPGAVAIPLRHHQVAAAPTGPRFERLYGIQAGGAVLVRPDGHVAYRSRPGEDHHHLKRMLGGLLDLDGVPAAAGRP